MTGGASAQFIWLSDLHYDDAPVLGHDAGQRVDAAVAFINEYHADAGFCVISGDMVETASDAGYVAIKQRLDRLAMPWWPMTGNHDRRGLLRRHLPLPEGAMDTHVQYVLEAGPVRLICLDSLSEGEDKGHLCPARLDWLQRALQSAPERPTIVMLHHPPIPLGLPMLDPDRLKNGDELLDLLARFPGVRQVCFGHVHRPVSGSVRGIAYTGLRAVLYQAPPPMPPWDWDSFAPAREAPQLGLVQCRADQIGIQMLEFCSASNGVTQKETS